MHRYGKLNFVYEITNQLDLNSPHFWAYIQYDYEYAYNYCNKQYYGFRL